MPRRTGWAEAAVETSRAMKLAAVRMKVEFIIIIVKVGFDSVVVEMLCLCLAMNGYDMVWASGCGGVVGWRGDRQKSEPCHMCAFFFRSKQNMPPTKSAPSSKQQRATS